MEDYTVKGRTAPDMTSAAFLAALKAAQSPVSAAEAEAVYAYTAARKVSHAWLLAVFAHESSMGKAGTATQTHSWGNTREPSFGAPSLGAVAGRVGAFSRYANWVDGGVSTVARVCDHQPYRGKDTVRSITATWAPPSENDTERYIAAVLADIARYAAPQPPEPTKGATMPAPTIEQHITPVNHWQGRNGNPVEAVVVHVSEGGKAGVDSWFHNPDSEASAHYLVNKDGTIWQFVEEGDTAWANGKEQNPNLSDPLIKKWHDAGTNPNRATISIETERNWQDRLTPPQLASLVWLAADVHRRYGLPTDGSRLFGHNEIDSVDRARCPSLSAGEWSAVINGLGGAAPPPAPAAEPMLNPVVTERQDWQGQGKLIRQTVVVKNTVDGKYFERVLEYEAAGPVLGEWKEI